MFHWKNLKKISLIILLLIAVSSQLTAYSNYSNKLQKRVNNLAETILQMNQSVALSGEAEREYYPVTNIIDGDSIKVEINSRQEQVRLLGINTPEIGPKTECYGPEATQFLKQLLKNQKVFLLADYANTDRDIYGRLLRYVYLRDNTQINALLIKAGYARVYQNFSIAYLNFYLELEKVAQSEKRGLWSPLNCLQP